MTRSALLLALALLTATPALARPSAPPDTVRAAAPTRAQRDVMEQNVENLTDSVRAAEQRVTDLRPGADRSEAMASVREFRGRLDAARDDLDEAERRIAAERASSQTGRVAASSDSAARGGERAAQAEADTIRRGSEPVDEPFPLLPVLAGIAALGAAGGAAWWFFQKRKPTPVARPPYGSIPGASLPGQTVSRHEFDRLSEQVRGLVAEHRTLSDWVRQDYERRQKPAAPTPAEPPAPAPAAPALAPADAAAAAFADWCRQGTPMMSRVEFFAGALGNAVPGASARAVYRDLNSQAEPLRFDDRGGASPAEFWLISAGGETLLFPQPLNAGQFRDLTRVFEGTAAPKSVGHVVPARVRDEGGAFALTAPGRVG